MGNMADLKDLDGILFEDMKRKELIRALKAQAQTIIDLQDRLKEYENPSVDLRPIPHAATGDEFPHEG